MKIFLNHSAVRYFKLFLFLTLAMPVLAVMVLLIIGIQGGMFTAVLFINEVFFTPVRWIFGSGVIPIEEFGPNPGVAGFGAAIFLYSTISFILANAFGVIVEKKKAS